MADKRGITVTQHRWRRWRRRCTCGWKQREGAFHGGWSRPLNFRYHLADMNFKPWREA